MRLYSFRDIIKNTFSPPLMCITDGQAWREFDAFINRTDDRGRPSYESQHPEEFELYYLADFDEATGEILPTTPKQMYKHLDVQDLITEGETIG